MAVAPPLHITCQTFAALYEVSEPARAPDTVPGTSRERADGREKLALYFSRDKWIMLIKNAFFVSCLTYK